MTMEKQKEFVFKPSFYSNFDRLCSYINETTSKIKKMRPNDFTYGSCNTGYNLRFLTPDNISTFVDNFSKAIHLGLIDGTHESVNKFMVASIKKFLEENGCPAVNNYTINTRPMHVDMSAQTPSDLISFIEGEMVKTSVYSAIQIKERFELVQKDLQKFEKYNFVNVTKRIVAALPGIIKKNLISNVMIDDIIMDIISQFILFSTTLNSLSLKRMWEYVFPKKTLGFSIKSTERNQSFVESAVINNDPMLMKLTDGIFMNKTNMVMLKEQLPIDMNIKNIVLQDQTKEFDEMISALKFMLSDQRSPITHLLLKYNTDKQKRILVADNSQVSCADGSNVVKMFMRYDIGDYEQDKLFKTENNWLDLIVSGNNFLDHNYRRDIMTNHVFTNPILNTLDMIYRIYGQELTNNVELVSNIIKVSNIMLFIAQTYVGNKLDNRPLVKDILTVFGEIITRDMLQLYWNNNTVIDMEMNLPDTMSPAYIYKDIDIMEGFIMEAGSPQTPPKQTMGGKTSGISVSVKNATNKTGDKIKVVIRNFQEWVRKQLGTLGSSFNQKHAADINAVRAQQKTNAEIGQMISQGFNPVVNNFNKYQVPFKNIQTKAANISSIVQKIMDDPSEQVSVDIGTYQKELLPDGVNFNDIQSATKGKPSMAVRNYVLFGKTEGEKPTELALDKTTWDDIINNISNTPKVINDLSNTLKNELEKVSNMLGQKITVESIQEIIAKNDIFFQEETTQPSSIQSSAGNNNSAQSQQMPSLTNDPGNNANSQQPTAAQTNKPPVDAENSRASHIFKNIVMPLTVSFYTPILNTLRNEFFINSYKVYRDVVEVYQQQNQTGNPNQVNPTMAQNTVTNQQQPNTINPQQK